MSQDIEHKGKNTAYHMDWQFRREAAVWDGNRPVRINLYPIGTELRDWMLRKGSVGVISTQDNYFTNPYTCDASVLAVAFASIINDCHDFANSTEPLSSLDAEIKGVRLYTEYVLYTARLCEAFIKQLLFCTSFPSEDYRGSALGSLLSKDCLACRPYKEKRHKVSLLGSLAHRYRLCHFYEKCLNEHVKIVHKRRDIEAAHSGVTKFAEKFARKPVAEIRKQFETEVLEVGNDFVHMLQHISDIEDKMLTELNSLIRAEAGRICPLVIATSKQQSAASC
jgi:hypothetical protein